MLILVVLFGECGVDIGAIVSNLYFHWSLGIACGFVYYDFVFVNNKSNRRADVAVDRAMKWMTARGDAPFFLPRSDSIQRIRISGARVRLAAHLAIR